MDLTFLSSPASRNFVRRIVPALAHRLVQAVLVALLVGTLCFFMTRMLPGDMAYRIAAGRYGYDMVTTAAAEAVRLELCLDRPWPAALAEWWGRLLRFDLGVSQVTAQPVAKEIAWQLGPTLNLSLLAMALSLLIGPTLGVLAGLKPGGMLDRLTLAVSTVLRALPSFLLGLVLVLLFSVKLGVLPAAGHDDHGSILLPALTLALGMAAGAVGITAVAVALPFGATYWALLPGIVVLSIGQGMTWTAMWIVAGQGVPAAQQGVASGMAATAQQIGGALGLAVLVMLANAGRGVDAAGTSPEALHGLVNAQYGAAVFALLGVGVAVWLRPQPQPDDAALSAACATER